jgi:SAM-dependent methyltransferase
MTLVRPDRETHETLFTSGDYVGQFQPEERANPFARTYIRKRDAVVGLVEGEGRAVLDVGGGPGRMAIPLSRRHSVTLCDLSLDMLRIARAREGGLLRGLSVADARRLPFASGSFDYVLCIDVLPHLPDTAPALAEFRRVLKPGGTLIVDSTNSVPLWTLAYPRYLGKRPHRWWRIWRAQGVLPEWRARIWHRPRGEFFESVVRAGFVLRASLDFGPALCPKWHVAVAIKR